MDNKKSEHKEKVVNKASEILGLIGEGETIGQFTEALALAAASMIYVAQESHGADGEMEAKIFGEKLRHYVTEMKAAGIRPMKWKTKRNKPTKKQ